MNKKSWISIGTILFVILGFICFVIGARIANWNIWEWFVTPTAFLLYAVVLLIILMIIPSIVKNGIGGSDDY